MTLAFIFAACSSGKIRHSGDLLVWVIAQIKEMGGTSCTTIQGPMISEWTALRDQTGLAVDARKVDFRVFSNALAQCYGQPRLYAPPNNRHKGTWLFPVEATKVGVFLSEKNGDANQFELTILDTSAFK